MQFYKNHSDKLPYLRNILISIGLFSIAKLSFGIITYLFKSLLNRPYNIKNVYSCEKTFVVITGASDGIGKQFAFFFAKQSFNLILIGRNKDKLKNVQNQIKEKINNFITIKIIVADFAESANNPNLFQFIENQMKDIQISILINNAGINNAKRFHQISQQQLRNQINVNLMSSMLMIHKIIPLMLQRKKKSLIINISSYSSLFDSPYLANYAATKSYLSSLSRSLTIQYKDFLNMRPYLTKTKMIRNVSSFYAITPKQFVETTIKCVGVTNDTIGHWKHQAIYKITKIFPSLRQKNIKQVYKIIKQWQNN